ncbi:hypothetical protein BCF55_0862 [Hydrogenivirga caldilitoris]|uniref:Uncharacterized protein n=1 Tax=Hydrogenivirga caldilitoris TaxID=246264 RepID=A0A497XNP4_9AQUI|nr:hypothetical protein [Hydrogenivirga caldilitoris]RLJ70586.1 hypothetical protein BCF55_0862 [Hydrogenivirga caldilitoris]
MEDQELRLEELYELIEEVDSVKNPTWREVEDLNYRLRKFLEALLIRTKYDYELLDLYYRVGENYEEIKGNPSRGLKTIREILISVVRKLEGE